MADGKSDSDSEGELESCAGSESFNIWSYPEKKIHISIYQK